MKNMKMIALASALCTAFTCTSASLTAFGIKNELPENTFEYENVYMQIVSDQHSSKPYLVVTGFTDEALQSGIQSTSLHLPPEIDTCMMPGFEGQEEYGALEVRKIGNEAFAECKNLTEVILPYTVKEIGQQAFESCMSLTEVRFDDTYNHEEPQLKTISTWAFSFCRKLENIDFPRSLDTIGEGAFLGCTSLKEVTIPAMSICCDAFASCLNLANVTITHSNADIDDYVFFNDTVRDPLHPEDIQNYLFYGTIHGYRGSTAQEYAERHNYNFEYLSELGQDAGDLTGDKAVSVEDAQLALMEYTAVSVAGKSSTLTFEQRRNADINRDGAVSVEDAQLILKYYVQNTVAGTPATWEELLYGKVEIKAPEEPVTTPAVTTTTEAAQTTTIPVATTVVVIQTTSAAVTTVPASTTVPVTTTAPASAKVPVTTTDAMQTTTAK